MRLASVSFRDSAGMTLAEVLLALGIIMVGLVSLIAAVPLSTSQIGAANLKTTATFLAQQRLEQIKNARWTSAVDALGGALSFGDAAVAQWPDEGYNTIVIAAGGNNASYPRYRREVRITDCSRVACSGIGTGVAGIDTLRQVTVTVFFFPLAGTGLRSGAEESVQLATLITRRP